MRALQPKAVAARVRGPAMILVLAFLATTFLASQRTLAAEMTVKIANFTFAPERLTVKAGTTVTWVNDDDIPHVVAEKDGKFRSEALDTGDKYSQVFSKPGTVAYYCAIHPHMTGEIEVTP
jgi:plastocyanin